MMIATKVENAEISGKTIDRNFDIGDPAIIIEFMSKTIYSNPLKVAIQEYATNARDSHIEIGNSSIPIKIICPNRFDNSIKICDNGPGITPERMKDVFIRYGVSTKRKDNTMSGGWGLGGKSFWAYTDTFNIRTICKEKGKLVLRNYSAIREGGKAPRLIEFGDPLVINVNNPAVPDCDKMTGTIISAEIKPEHFEACKQHIIDITKFWNVRPIIEGCTPLPEYPEFKWAYEGENWKIGYDVNDYSSNSFICIDGIPYPINKHAFSDLAQAVDVYEICKTNYVLFFNVGELSVSLSRESLQYDERTKKAIVQRLVEMKSWLNANLQKQIENAPTLWDATVMYKKLNSVFAVNQVVGDVSWNGYKLSNNASIYCQFGNCRRYYNEVTPGVCTKIKSKKDYSVKIEEDTLFVIVDEPKFHIGKIATLLDQHPNKQIYVYTPENDQSLDKLRAKCPGFDEYKPIYISTVIKKKMPKAVPTGTRSPWYLMKETETITADSCDFDDEISYKTDSGYYVLQRRNRIYGTFNSHKDIQNFLATYAPNETVYIVKDKYEFKLSEKFIKFEELVKKVYNEEIVKVDYKTYLAKNNNKSYTFKNSYGSSELKNFISLNIEKLNETFLKKWIDLGNSYLNENDDEEIAYLISIGNKLSDSRVSGTELYGDDQMKKYFEKFKNCKTIFESLIREKYYWNDEMTPEQKSFAEELYLMAIKKIFVDN